MRATKVIMILVWAVYIVVGGGGGGVGEENCGRGEEVVCGVKENKHSQ